MVRSACERVHHRNFNTNFNTFSFRYESYLRHSDPVVLALNPFFVLEYVYTNLLLIPLHLAENLLPSETIQCHREAVSSPGRLRSLSPHLASSTTSAWVSLNQTPSVGHPSIWTSIAGYSALHVSRPIMGVGWKPPQTLNMSSYSGAANFVWSLVHVQQSQLLTITHFPNHPRLV